MERSGKKGGGCGYYQSPEMEKIKMKKWARAEAKEYDGSWKAVELLWSITGPDAWWRDFSDVNFHFPHIWGLCEGGR